MRDFEKRIFEEIKFKKKIDHLSEENKNLKESITELSATVEELKQALINLQRDLRGKISEENILDAIVYAIEEVKEID
ncbi:hypothetical protein COL22_25840 [Bacillus thuringiensis]|uniref:hypothetical protein n=1 Tax=Bacillus thuringiensis TaxID=1428 RepID=UPI000BF25B99|nr:hypothetical protein [Bacillus thuringiensis]PFW04134.1 hypothetical protein COL22_25840 [Bacillus thuringiensis]